MNNGSFKENKNFVRLFFTSTHTRTYTVLKYTSNTVLRLESVKTNVNMAKLTFLIILILFMVISTLTAMNPLSDIVKKCFGHHKLVQFNYILGQIDDDSLLNMANTFRENQEEFFGSLEW